MLIKTKLLTIGRTLRSCVGGIELLALEAVEVMVEEGENIFLVGYD